jgi:phospholipid/cholesterol/gamma-HCH transport system substrate-binding protein
MDERIVQFRVGVMVLATLIITGMLVMLFGKFPGFGVSNFTVQMRFVEAPGVSVDTPVRKNGIFIGRVTDVSFADDSDDVVVTAQLSKPDKIFEHDVPRVGGSLLGDAVIEFVRPGDVARSPERIQNGKIYPRGLVTPQPLERLEGFETQLATAVNSVERTSQQWNKVGAQVSKILGENETQLGTLLEDMEKTMKRLDLTLDNTNKLLGDPQIQADIKKAAAELPKTLEDSRKAIASVEESMAAMRKTVDVADRNLKNLEEFTKPLGEKGSAIMKKIDGSATKFDALLSDLTQFSKNLNNPQGTLGRLLNDPELHDSLVATIVNVEKLTYDLKPILNDVRVFTDKIARHPEKLGVRGAIQPSTGIK